MPKRPKKKIEPPECRFQKRDCHAYMNGHCVALYGLRKIWTQCPFYKSEEQFRKEEQHTIARLKMMGFDELINRYPKGGNNHVSQQTES